ncbi:MAG: response regulator [Minicystis sp.]
MNDDDTSRYLITKWLSRAGFSVREAATGREALALAGQRPDFVVLDVRLPDVDGFEVCQRLKADPRTASIPVLLTSATFVSSDKRVQGLDGGADGYLTQPFEPVELVATIRALLRARQAEDAARSAARDWEATFDGITDGVCMLDAEGSVRRYNRAFQVLLRVPGELSAGRSAEELLAAVDTDARAALAHLFITGDGACEARAGDRWLRLRADPLPEGQGSVIIVTDESEHRRLEEELRRRAEALSDADRRKDEFLAMLAHELRNPLHAISMALHIQESIGARDDASVHLRGAMRRQMSHLTRLVDDLLDVSRITRGKILLKRELYDVRIGVERAAETCRALIEARRHALHLHLPPEPVIVDGDPVRLEQVIVNLLNNAAKYSEPGGRITVTLLSDQQTNGGTAALSVRDEGVGIPPAMLEAVFDLFMQEDQSLARSVGGLGIGLTMARRLVELHGGTISAHSEGRGRGAELCVRLPLATHPAQRGGGSEAGENAPVSALTGLRAKRILVVEDNPDAAEALVQLLSLGGHDVEVANDGLTGLDLARTTRPDVAVLDIGLPGLDGYQIAAQLRADPACDTVCLVAVTGYGRAEDRAQALRAGFDAHVVKPVEPMELLRVVGQALTRIRARAAQGRAVPVASGDAE